MGKSKEPTFLTRREFSAAVCGGVGGLITGVISNVFIPEVQGWIRSLSITAVGKDLETVNEDFSGPMNGRQWRVKITNGRWVAENNIFVEILFLSSLGDESPLGKLWAVTGSAQNKGLADAVFGRDPIDKVYWNKVESDPFIINRLIPRLGTDDWVEFVIYTTVDVQQVFVSAKSDDTSASLRSEHMGSSIEPGTAPDPTATPKT